LQKVLTSPFKFSLAQFNLSYTHSTHVLHVQKS